MRVPPGVLIPADRAVLLAVCADAIRDRWKASGLVPPEVEAMLADLHAAAKAHGEAVKRQRASSEASAVDLPLVAAGSSGEVDLIVWMTADEASQKLGVSVRAVTDLANRGRLRGARREPGTRRWAIPAAAVDRRIEERNRRSA